MPIPYQFRHAPALATNKRRLNVVQDFLRDLIPAVLNVYTRDKAILLASNFNPADFEDKTNAHV